MSEVGEDKIRWILDDVLTFVKREARRGAKYDGIILDPPAFGRGAKGEVWKIEEDFQTLLESLKELLSDKSGSFFLLNGYAAGYASCAFAQAVESVFGNVDGESGELHIKESTGERIIPSGIMCALCAKQVHWKMQTQKSQYSTTAVAQTASVVLRRMEEIRRHCGIYPAET